MMADLRQITIQIQGSLADRGDVRLEDLVEELGTIRNALRETERMLTGSDPSLYFRIVGLSHRSPAIIVLEAASDSTTEERTSQVAGKVVRHFTANLRFLSRKHRPSRTASVPVLESYREMTQPLQKHVTEVIIRAGKHSVVINESFKRTIESVLGPEETAYGSISGTIEAINIHCTNKFHLYPTIGPARISGRFRPRLRSKFTSALDKYVTIYGLLRYKTWDKFPFAVVAEDIEVHEPPAPTLFDIRGMAPGATGNLTSDEFLDRLRDEHWQA
jgi:hypothetical protein